MAFDLGRTHIQQARRLKQETPPPFSVVLSGKLDVIGHSQRSFKLRTETGDTVRGVVQSSEMKAEKLSELWGDDVTIQGQAHFTPGGSLQFGWGTRKKEQIQRKLNSVRVVSLQSGDLIDRYAEVDAYSQNALPDRELGESDRNMGKNDVWIAATASVVATTLITSDDDFDHLDGEFLNRIYVDPDAEHDL